MPETSWPWPEELPCTQAGLPEAASGCDLIFDRGLRFLPGGLIQMRGILIQRIEADQRFGPKTTHPQHTTVFLVETTYNRFPGTNSVHVPNRVPRTCTPLLAAFFLRCVVMDLAAVLAELKTLRGRVTQLEAQLESQLIAGATAGTRNGDVSGFHAT